MITYSIKNMQSKTGKRLIILTQEFYLYLYLILYLNSHVRAREKERARECQNDFEEGRVH